jgi:Flp pilus assembly pilin Flp
MKILLLFIQVLWIDEKGAVASEYALLISGIAVAVTIGISLFGSAVQTLYQNAVDRFPK